MLVTLAKIVYTKSKGGKMATEIVNYINIALAVLGFIGMIASFIFAYVKAKKNGKSISMLSLIEKIPLFVTTAETIFGKGNGRAKLEYVLTQLKMLAMENGLTIDDAKLRADVNSVVLATNYVNVAGSKTNSTEQEQSNKQFENATTISQDDKSIIVDNKMFGE